jgi:2-desacetyl-2-hydroxyethyl bacteriochlorophyllide A dehydrogenase
MKALVCAGPRKISCESVPDPVLADARSAIVKTSSCAICGSDLHPYHVDLGRPAYCIGHEAVGEVVEVGRDVKKFSVGDRVLLAAALSCGQCQPCRDGNVVFCKTYSKLRAFGQSLPDVGGCQAEAVAVPVADENMFHLPQSMPDEVGLMLTDTLSTARFAAQRARVGPGDVVAVIGMGAVGLQSVMCAVAMGASRVLAIDLLSDRRRHAVELGAEAVDNPDVAAGVNELTQGQGVDVVIDATGGPVTTALAIELIGKGGRISVVGISEQWTVPFPIKAALYKNMAFHTGICSAQAQIPALLHELESGKLSSDALAKMITHRMGLSEGSEAYAFFDARKDGVIKVLLDPAR